VLISNNTTKDRTGPSHEGGPQSLTYPAGKRQRVPTHPGAVVRGALEALGVNPNKAALAIGMTRQGLSKLVKEESPVTPVSAVLVSAYLGTGPTGPEHLLHMQVDFDLWQARKRLAARLAKIKAAPRSSK
jgi:addiction module HigA family antidote